jgi:predicted RNase H-like HicB family nuclease/plasmid stability protein
VSTKKESREIEAYASRPYPITFYPAEEGGYVAEIEDLPGCLAQGESPAEAVDAIEQCKRAWIATAFEQGIEVPLPRTEVEYSGKFLVRMPKSLHRRLAARARQDEVSLNAEVVSLLSAALETREQQAHAKELVRAFQDCLARTSASASQQELTPKKLPGFTYQQEKKLPSFSFAPVPAAA